MKQFQNYLRLLWLCAAFVAIDQANAQTTVTPTLLQTGNTFIQQRIERSDPQGWLFFKNSSDLKEGQLFSEQPSSAGLSANDNMTLVETSMDDEGNTHNRYQQFYKGIKVEGGEIFEHARKCYVYILNGNIIEGLNFNAQPVYSESQARTIAIASIGASQYAWESTTSEQGLKDDTGDPNATFYPTGALALTNLPGTSLETGNFVLTWKFEIIAISPSSQQTVYVNASTGAVLKTIDMARSNGPAGTLYDGIKTIDTRWFGGLFHGHHHLDTDDNDGNNRKIQTKNGSAAISDWYSLNHVYDSDDIWGLDVPTVRTTSAHWVVNQSWDFFKVTYGRTGPRNNNSCKVSVYGNSTYPNNAIYRGSISTNNVDFLEFGTSTIGNTDGIPAGVNYACLDVGGHEYTHAIARNEANFNYRGESGALDESFADIFGVMIERYARGGISNWTLGEDLGYISRNMQTPAASVPPQPQTYLTDPLWFNTVGCTPTPAAPPAGNDYCGVHINGGVQNRWFYLLSQGGTQNGVSVQGIGMDKAARIAYGNLTNYLGSSANYPSSRIGAIASARDLFGDCSNEVIQTTNAWAAVGVGTTFSGNCLALNGDRILCKKSPDFPYVYVAQGLAGATFSWTFPSTWTGVLSGPGNNTLNITSYGSYVPVGGYPASEIISVSSSLGGTTSISVKIYDECLPLLCGGDRSDENQIKIENLSGEIIQVFPNPTRATITILHPEINNGLLAIYSIFGTKMIEITPLGNSSVLDLSKFANGTYIVSVNLGDRTVTKRFIKSN